MTPQLSSIKRRLAIVVLSLLMIGVAACRTYVGLGESRVVVGACSSNVVFAYGNDSDQAGVQIGPNLTSVRFDSLSGVPNATRIYTDSVRVLNTESHTRESSTIELIFDRWSGDTTWVDFIKARLFNGSIQVGLPLYIGVQGSSTGEIVLPAGQALRLQFEIRWKPSCPLGESIEASLLLRVT